MYCISTIYVDVDTCVISQYWPIVWACCKQELWSFQTAAIGNRCSSCYITPHVTSSQIMSLSITHTSKTTVVLILDLLAVRSRLSSSITAGELYRCLHTWFSPLFTTRFVFYGLSVCCVIFEQMFVGFSLLAAPTFSCPFLLHPTYHSHGNSHAYLQISCAVG